MVEEAPLQRRDAAPLNKRGERELGFGRDEEVLIYECFRSNGSDSSGIHPTAAIHRAKVMG
jgi:hypothetical protein